MVRRYFFVEIVLKYIYNSEVMGNWCSSEDPQLNSLNPLEKLEWKLRIAVNASIDNKIKLLQEPEYAGLLKLLDKVPDSLFVKFLQRTNESIFNSDPSDWDPKKNFINWGKTFETSYQEIYYPTEVPARTGRQIQGLQDFVQNGVKSGKRVRGAGIRHSWGSIFSDPEQLLISFYPYKIAKGTSTNLEDYAKAMMEAQESLLYDRIENLCMIVKVGEVDEGHGKKHLVKVGAGVSNDQMRRWCIKNGYQYRSNVIMVEVNVCGGLGTCSHGAGLSTQTLADYVYEIEFIDHNGNRQIVSKKTMPNLIKSAASAMGLLGPVIFVTLEMEDLEIVRSIPNTTYKDFAIPWPKNYPIEKQKLRKQRKQWQVWTEIQHKKAFVDDWQKNVDKFKANVNETYCEWFYFPTEEIHVFQNIWNIFGKKTEQNIKNIKQDNPDGVFLNDYPPPAIRAFSEFSLFSANQLVNHELTHSANNILLRAPFTFFPHRNFYINYPDAVHFQRGIQNIRVRDFQCEINIPSIHGNGRSEPDYDLIQQIWWAGLEIAEENKQLINMGLEMRIFRGSEATLAPQMGMDFVCSIEIIRTLALNSKTEKVWAEIVLKVFNAWRSIRDAQGKALTIRPHWGKQWDFYPEVKNHVLQDESLKANVRKFLSDYQQIAKLKKFDHHQNLQAFSNKIYRELLNNAIQSENEKIK